MDYLGYTFGATVYSAGLISFLRRGKKSSFVVGTVFGGLAILGAHHASENPDEPLLAAANSGCLGGYLLLKNIIEIRRGGVSSDCQIAILKL